jgi:large subunit ribosomal protein L23
MEPTQIILKPLITEKSAWQGERHNRYAFKVDARATKPQIRHAIEQLYKVRVQKVATQNRRGEVFRVRWGVTTSPSWKRALVQLHPEDKIDLI